MDSRLPAVVVAAYSSTSAIADESVLRVAWIVEFLFNASTLIADWKVKPEEDANDNTR